jgi:hypothetical protein
LKTIYTAIFGNYDDLKEPFIITPGWRYICFTDQDLKSDVWEIVKVPVMSCGPSKTARFYKIMFHKHIESEFSIWIDATFIINIDLDIWWKRFKPSFTTIKHPFEKCIYKEAESCMRMQKANPGVLKNQIACYRKLGVPKNNGLIASGILMRQNTEELIKFCRTWWHEVETFSPRDQVAFGKANHKHPNTHTSIEWDYTQREEFIHIPHLSKKWRSGRLEQMLKKYGKLHSI